MALDWGLVTHVFDNDTFWDDVAGLAGRFADKAPVAVQAARKLIRRSYEVGLAEGLEAEKSSSVAALMSEEAIKSVEDFLRRHSA